MGTGGSFEATVTIYHNIRCYIPEVPARISNLTKFSFLQNAYLYNLVCDQPQGQAASVKEFAILSTDGRMCWRFL
jgi:hypothetical protein